jgi:hypothetical protein
MEQLAKTRFQNVIINKKLRIGDDKLDDDQQELLYVAGDMKVQGQMGFTGAVAIDNDLVINGSLTVKGNQTVIESETYKIHDNTIELNAGLQNLDEDFARETGIIIHRPVKNGFPQKPFKIVYKDVTENGIDHNDILDIGLEGELRRVATINDYPTNMGVPMWNDVSGILDTETNIKVEKHSIGGNSTSLSQNLHVRNGTIFNTGRDGQHYDIDILYQPPPKFTNNGIEITSANFTISWRKDFIIKKLAFLNTEVPIIDNIAIDIQRVDPITDWIEVTKDIPKTDETYTFVFNQDFGEFKLISDTSYNVRVYGLNNVEQTTDNYLIYENLQLKNAGVPSEPTGIGLFNATLETFNVRFTTPNDNDTLEDGNQSIPIIKEYKYVYRNNETNSDRSVPHEEEIFTEIYETSSEDRELSKEISFNITGLFPGTQYQLISLQAKNEVSTEATGYGEDGVKSSIITIKTLTPNTNEYYRTMNPSGSVIIENKREFRRQSVLYDLTYYNIHSTQGTPTAFNISSGLSTFFVNNGAIGRKGLVFIIVTYNTGTGTGTNLTYTTNNTLRYITYNNTINGSTSTTHGLLGFSDISCADAKREDLDFRYSGFGLYGSYKLNPESIGTKFAPSSNIRGIQYEINNYGGLNGLTDISAPSGTTTSIALIYEHIFVVDDLSRNPTISTINATMTNPEVVYNHGIPTIKEFNVSLTYTVNNIGSRFLPSDGIISTITTTTKINGITNKNITSTTIPANLSVNVNEEYTNCSVNKSQIMSLIDSKTIENIAIIKPINLLFTNEPNVNASLTDTNNIWIDVNSFTNSFELNEIAREVYTIELEQYQHTNGILANQLLYVNGVFTNNSIYYKNYSSGYNVGTFNYSSISTTGTNINGTNYKWVVKRYRETSLSGTTQFKQFIITINGSVYRIQDLIGSGIRLFVRQIEVNGEYESAWVDPLEEFNTNMTSLLIEGAGNRAGPSNNYYAVFQDKPVVEFDFYVRIGLPVGGTTYSITNIQFISAIL